VEVELYTDDQQLEVAGQLKEPSRLCTKMAVVVN
jgi:hypothetical protein